MRRHWTLRSRPAAYTGVRTSLGNLSIDVITYLEWLPETLTNSGSLILEDQVERRNFLNDVKVVCRQLTNPAKVVNSCLTAVL